MHKKEILPIDNNAFEFFSVAPYKELIFLKAPTIIFFDVHLEY